MKRVVRLIISLPPLLLLILFALSNREPARLTLWPTDFSVELPLALAVLGTAAVGFLFGGLLVWVTTLGQRRRARHAEAAVRLLEDEVRLLKARLTPPQSFPPQSFPPQSFPPPSSPPPSFPRNPGLPPPAA